MRDVAIVGFAQHPNVAHFPGNEIEMLLPVVSQAIASSGLQRGEIDVTTAASNDFFAGQAFAFVRALDAVGAYPVIDDSHVDMDGAWALYEAWVRIQTGEVDTALVYALGRTSAGRLHEITPLQYDPYSMQMLGIAPTDLAALQARVLLEAAVVDERAMGEIVARSWRDGVANPRVWHEVAPTLEEYLASPKLRDPLRALDCAPQTDGAAAIVLASAERAADTCETPVWIRGIDHRIDTHYPGARELGECPSAREAGQRASQGATPDFAELSACYSHEEVLLRRELGLGADTVINPSGGALTANPIMATGLVRFVEAAARISRGEGTRGLVHASSGPCLQQNLVAVIEGGAR